MCFPTMVGESRNSLAAAAKEPSSATRTNTAMLVNLSHDYKPMVLIQ